MKIKTHLRQMKCLLVEDDQTDITIISQYIQNHERLQHVATTINPAEFSKYIRFDEIDIIFLDNELGTSPNQRNQGLELLNTLINLTHPNPIPYVISISHFPEDFQKAMEFNVWAFLSKPIGEENFKNKVDRVIDIIDDKEEIKRLRESTKKNSQIVFGRVAIKEKGTSQRFRFFDLSNIIYIESGPIAHDITIHLAEPQGDCILTTDTNFASLEGFLSGKINDNKQLTAKQLQYFGRIKKNCIVNLSYISDVEANTINLKGMEKPLNFGNTEYRNNIMNKYKDIFSK